MHEVPDLSPRGICWMVSAHKPQCWPTAWRHSLARKKGCMLTKMEDFKKGRMLIKILTKLYCRGKVAEIPFELWDGLTVSRSTMQSQKMMYQIKSQSPLTENRVNHLQGVPTMVCHRAIWKNAAALWKLKWKDPKRYWCRCKTVHRILPLV